MNQVIAILLDGAIILAVAILLNIAASKLNLSTWYEFVRNPKSTSPVSYIWLFAVYPFCLGLTAYFTFRLLGVL